MQKGKVGIEGLTGLLSKILEYFHSCRMLKELYTNFKTNFTV